jgi:predicted HD phosphohydrolase
MRCHAFVRAAWDDEAKVPGAITPTLDEFLPLIRGLLRPEVRADQG